MHPSPIYTFETTAYAFQLCWGITLFWRQYSVPDTWLSELKPLCECAGHRILQHRLASDDCSQFLISPDPFATPDEVVRGLKGRLQSLMSSEIPKAFQRNYDIHSVGSTTRSKTEFYVRRQLVHHGVDNVDSEGLELAELQFENPDIDLGRLRFTSHGRYRCNLHVVLRLRNRNSSKQLSMLAVIRDTVRKTADRHHLQLSRLGLLEDHIHLVLGHTPNKSPASVCYSMMNNIAYAFGMQNVLLSSCYVGTIGEYDLGAIRKIDAQ